MCPLLSSEQQSLIGYLASSLVAVSVLAAFLFGYMRDGRVSRSSVLRAVVGPLLRVFCLLSAVLITAGSVYLVTQGAVDVKTLPVTARGRTAPEVRVPLSIPAAVSGSAIDYIAAGRWLMCRSVQRLGVECLHDPVKTLQPRRSFSDAVLALLMVLTWHLIPMMLFTLPVWWGWGRFEPWLRAQFEEGK